MSSLLCSILPSPPRSKQLHGFLAYSSWFFITKLGRYRYVFQFPVSNNGDCKCSFFLSFFSCLNICGKHCISLHRDFHSFFLTVIPCFTPTAHLKRLYNFELPIGFLSLYHPLYPRTPFANNNGLQDHFRSFIFLPVSTTTTK